MTLGEILDRLNEPDEVYQLLVEAGDLAGMARLQDEAARSGRDPAEIALHAVHAFTASADDAAWISLMGHIQQAESPAGVCLSEMIVWAGSREHNTCEHGACGHEHSA